MRLPIQSQPVQRTITSQPFALRDASEASDGEHGVQPSTYGVQPSFGLGDIVNIIKKAGSVADALGGLF
jgi:hypothetical protein